LTLEVCLDYLKDLWDHPDLIIEVGEDLLEKRKAHVPGLVFVDVVRKRSYRVCVYFSQ